MTETATDVSTAVILAVIIIRVNVKDVSVLKDNKSKLHSRSGFSERLYFNRRILYENHIYYCIFSMGSLFRL